MCVQVKIYIHVLENCFVNATIRIWNGGAIALLRSFAEGGLSYLQHYSYLLISTKQHYFKLTNLYLQNEEHNQLTVDSQRQFLIYKIGGLWVSLLLLPAVEGTSECWTSPNSQRPPVILIHQHGSWKGESAYCVVIISMLTLLTLLTLAGSYPV